MARKIVITSGKGGVGKTTICANLGYFLSQQKLKVLLIDADVGLNNLDVVIGVENKITYDLTDIISGKCRSRQAVIQNSISSNLYIIPSNNGYWNFDNDGECLKSVLEELDEYFDYILIDCPAGIENGFLRALSCSQEALIVTTPHLSAIRDADKVANILRSCDIDIIGVVVNRARGDLIINNEMLGIDKVRKFLNLDVFGVVPEDDFIGRQLLIGGKLEKQANSYSAFDMMVKKIHYNQNRVFDCTKKYKGIIGLIRRSLKKWV